jgi:hypothetical protein
MMTQFTSDIGGNGAIAMPPATVIAAPAGQAFGLISNPYTAKLKAETIAVQEKIVYSKLCPFKSNDSSSCPFGTNCRQVQS